MIIPRSNFGLFRRNRSDPNRPVLKPEMSPVDWLLETVALTGLAFFLGYALFKFPHLPDSIPTHFNGMGKADEYGGKDSFLVLPGVAVCIYLLLTMINLVPYTFNFMVKITPANALRQYTLATRMIRALKSVLVWMFWYISYATVQVAGGAEGLGAWFLPVFLGIIFVPMVIYFILSHRNR
jgi:uncharacterized membrane protein